MKYRWAAVLGHCFLIHSVAFILRPTATYRAIELDASLLQISVVGASFALLPVLLGVACGRVLDLQGSRKVACAGSIIVLTAAIVFAVWGDSIGILIVATALLGLGHLCCVVAQQVEVSQMGASDRLDSRLAYYTFVGSVAQALGPLVIIAFGVGRIIPDTDALFATATAFAIGLALVSTRFAPVHAARSSTARRESAKVPRRRRELVAAMICGAMILSAVDILSIYLPVVAADRGFSSASVGLLLSLRAGTSMFTRLFFGWLIRHAGRRRLLLWSLSTTAAAFALLVPSLSIAFVAVGVAIAGLCLGVGQPLTMSWVISITPASSRGSVLATRLTFNRIAQTLVPLAAGGLSSGVGVGGVLAMTSGAMAATCLGAWKIGRNSQ